MAIIKLNPINRFLQRHRKSKLPPCGEFQSRMNLVMLWTASQTLRQGSHYHFQPDQERMVQQESKLMEDNKIHVYRACVLSSLLYGTESWTSPEYQAFLGKRGKMEAKKGKTHLKSPLP